MLAPGLSFTQVLCFSHSLCSPPAGSHTSAPARLLPPTCHGAGSAVLPGAPTSVRSLRPPARQPANTGGSLQSPCLHLQLGQLFLVSSRRGAGAISACGAASWLDHADLSLKCFYRAANCLAATFCVSTGQEAWRTAVAR